jgi:hypothetical protein
MTRDREEAMTAGAVSDDAPARKRQQIISEI